MQEANLRESIEQPETRSPALNGEPPATAAGPEPEGVVVTPPGGAPMIVFESVRKVYEPRV
ncbi:MAG TPA: hypothetical protein VK915_13790, partial [Gaiellaceae bacterium]|nr:hypothetical protein [Gaiellaceae bacterium]